MMVLRKNHELATTPQEKASSWLMIGAIFFAMRACEYTQTNTEATNRTKIIRIGNITFKKGPGIVNHSDPNLHNSDLVRIRFEYQKNDRRDVYIHMFKSDDPILCPVIAWATTVQRVQIIPLTTEASRVCLFENVNKRQSTITSDYIRNRLRAIVELLGEQTLGFTKNDIGTRSIRSGGAMAMFLSGTSSIVIQRVGRWSSDAFLEYIRDQVESFTAGVSQRMLKYETFFNLNTTSSTPRDQPLAVIEAEEEEITSEDGPDQVPFSIKFSNLALNKDA